MKALSRIWLALLAAAVAGLAQASPAVWTNVGPAGGRTTGVAVDPGDARHVIVLDSSGIAHETDDRGATWSTGAAPACAQFNGRGVIRGGSYYFPCYFSAQRTSDGGKSWRTFSPQPAGEGFVVRELLLDPLSASGALVASASGPRLTQDGGLTWSTRTYPVVDGVPPLAFDPSVPGRVVTILNANGPVVSVQGGSTRQVELWESLDTAATWRMTGIVYQYPSTDDCFGQAVAIDGQGTVYVISGCGVHSSRDRGLTWAFHDNRGSGVVNTSLAPLNIDPFRPGHVIVAGGGTIIETVDSGSTWSMGSSPPAFDESGQAIAFASDGAAWAATTKGLYRRDAVGSAWSQVAVTGQRSAEPPFVVPASADGQVLIAGTQRSVDGGATWGPRTGNSIFAPIRVAGRPSELYELTATGYELTVDGGATWQPIAFSPLDGTGKSVGNFFPAGAQPGLIYATSVSVADTGFGQIPGPAAMVRSDDGGKTWTSIDAGIAGAGRSVVPSPADTKVVYVITSEGLFRSTTAGATWAKVRSDALQVAPDSVDASTFYVLTPRAVVASHDGGASFVETTPDVRDSFVSMTADPSEAGRAYLTGMNGVVYQTRDRGASWQQAAIGRDDTIVGYVGPVVAAGNGHLLRVVHDSIYSIAVPADPFVLDAAVWWNPAESGWGLSIVQHPDNQAVVVWYYYDAQGEPRWSIVPGGSWTDARTFTGTMYVTTGPSYFGAPFDPSRVSAKRQGTATLRFTDADTADVSFVLDDGTRFDRHVARQRFAAQTAGSGNVSDLWWNPNESGWGIGMHQEGPTAFVTWFVYDAEGKPTWLVAPDMDLSAGSSSTSDLYATTGPSYTGPFDRSNVAVTRAGTLTIQFGDETRWLSYSAHGKSGATPIERQPF